MDLENIMQDTIVIQARAREKQGDRGRSKKWREILKLPPVAQCLSLRDEIDHSYEGLIEDQPVGKCLFEDFCSKDVTLSKCHQFMAALDDFSLVAEEKSATTAKQIYQDFLAPEEPNRLNPVALAMVAGIPEKLMQLPVPKDVFTKCKQTVREYLSGQPFIDYVDSQYYWRYLQWKYMEKAPITKNSFRVYRVLGKGGFGLVHACQSKPTGKMYALKKLEKKRVKKRKGEKLALNEKVILEKVDSRFVVNLAYAYQTKDELCMVLTLMNGGDLRFHVHNIGVPGLDMERTVFYAAEIAAGLSHLHTCRVAYRDMKPDNILLDDHGHVRISDLGLAVHIPEGQSVRGRVGTVGYMAPEVIDNHRYTFSPDWWGLGCVVYEMIHGECPFRKRKERVSREVVEKRVREDSPKYSDKFSAESKSFCSMLLDKAHSNRLGTVGKGFEEVKTHPFFKTINWNHLDKGILEPPFRPNPRAVYAKDVLDIDAFSSIRGVEIGEGDEEFASKFSSGACSKPWQEEMIEMKLFADINKMHPIESMTMESNTLSPEVESKKGWLKRLFRFKRQVSAPPGTVKDSNPQTSGSSGASTSSPKLPGQSPHTKTASVSAIPPAISSQQQRTQSHRLIAIPEIGVSGSTPPPEDQANSAPIIRSHTTTAAANPSLNVLRKSVLHASEENVQDPNPDKDVHITMGEARHQDEEGEAPNHKTPGEEQHSSGSSSSLTKHDPEPSPQPSPPLPTSNCNPSN